MDASTATIGLCIVDYCDDKAKLKHQEYYKPPTKGNLFERLAAVRLYIQEKIDEFKPDDLAIEDIALYMKLSTARTLATLAVLNRTVGLAIYNKTEKAPYLYNAMRIRHAIKLDKDLPSKEEIPELVAKMLNFKFPYEYRKKRDGSEILKDEVSDMADAIAVALCHIKMDRAGIADELQIKKKKKKKRTKKKVKKK